MKTRLLLLVAMLVPAVMSAQGLSGSVEGIGAYNFDQSNREDLNFRLNYDSPVWYIHSSLGGGHDYSPTDVIKLSANGKERFWDKVTEYTEEALLRYMSEDLISKYTWEDKVTCKRSWNANAGIDAAVRIGSADNLKMSLKYIYSASKDSPDIYNERLASEEHSTVITEVAGRQLDVIDFDRGRLDGIMEYTHDFDIPGRRISATLSTMMCFDTENKDRILENEEGIFYRNPKRYRMPSSINDVNWSATVHYYDNNLLGIRKLGGYLGLDIIRTNDIDFYKQQYYVDGAWRDSTQYNQGYLYSSLALEPIVNLNYNIGNFDISILQRLQFYNHFLAFDVDEEFNEDKMSVGLETSHVAEMINVNLAYRLNSRHVLSLEYDRNIVRPDYLKLTNMIKAGNTENEYYVGNTDLKPQINSSFFLKYLYTIGDNFEFYASAQYRHMRDKAEKVVDNQKDGKTYFTYINAGIQQTVSLRLDLVANYERFNGELYVQTNHEFIDYKDLNKESKRTFNIDIVANASYVFNNRWMMSARGGYATMKESAFNAKDAYVQTNLRLTRRFEKVDLYLEGRDLTEGVQYEYTWNESLDYCKITLSELCRRAVVLGLKYRF